MTEYDLLIVGGGINGVGIARDAAGRGLSVLLVEQDDLAQHTSSASTKLIHGGLRYLEFYDFGLVREALIERERLLGLAPHLVRPLRFVLPRQHSPRPAWMLRVGLFLYDHIGGRNRLPASKSVHVRHTALGAGLKPEIDAAFLYSDCWTDDSRLVVANAIDAAARGAKIRTRTRLIRAERSSNAWRCMLEDTQTGAASTVNAKVLINAAGPWVSELLCERVSVQRTKTARLVKGSHIVVPKLYDGAHALALQNPDRRIVFVIPYEGKYSLIGTTEIPWHAPPRQVTISAEETQYLCDSVNRYFDTTVSPQDVVWSYAGIRPLFDDAAKDATAVTREYVLDIDAPRGQPVLLSVFGGKITTYRQLAEHAMEKLATYLPIHGGRWTEQASLPGGDIANGDFDQFLTTFQQRYSFLPATLALRFARAYGTRADHILRQARSIEDLGMHFGGGLYQAEVDYLIQNEWARSAEDILQRRSKLVLHVDTTTTKALHEYIQTRSMQVVNDSRTMERQAAV